MRLILRLLLPLIALAACEPLPVVAPPSPPRPAAVAPYTQPVTPPGTEVAPVQTTTLTAPAAQGVVILAPNAQPVVTAPPAVAESPLLIQQRAACQREGGQLTPRAAGVYSCILRTPDAGRSCTQSSDCAGVCLARSGTCAPLQPLFGCHEVLTSAGRRETLCTE